MMCVKALASISEERRKKSKQSSYVCCSLIDAYMIRHRSDTMITNVNMSLANKVKADSLQGQEERHKCRANSSKVQSKSVGNLGRRRSMHSIFFLDKCLIPRKNYVTAARPGVRKTVFPPSFVLRPFFSAALNPFRELYSVRRCCSLIPYSFTRGVNGYAFFHDPPTKASVYTLDTPRQREREIKEREEKERALCKAFKASLAFLLLSSGGGALS